MPSRVRAVVRVVVDIEADSVWSGTTTFDQIKDQASSGVINMLQSGNELMLKDIPRRVHAVELLSVTVTPEKVR